jgi:lactate dehydrogenase-like 2-hydroxyacid dehydrogenase
LLLTKSRLLFTNKFILGHKPSPRGTNIANFSRGQVIYQRALFKALQDGLIACYAQDGEGSQNLTAPLRVFINT